MKKLPLVLALLFSALIYANDTNANTLTIYNTKPCQIAVTYIFSDGSTLNSAIGANPEVEMDFGEQIVVGATFYSIPYTIPLFSVGDPSYFSLSPMGSGIIAACTMSSTTAIWTPLAGNYLLTLI